MRWYLLLTLFAVILSLTLLTACGDDDDDDDDSNDDDDNGDYQPAGTCYFLCSSYIAEWSTCTNGASSEAECEELAISNCEGNDGSVDAYEYTTECNSCDDETCKPDWFLEEE